MLDNHTLFFLRSSEKHILKNLLSISVNPEQDIEFYGFSSKDLGLYTLVDNVLAGAVWIRLKDTNKHPVLNIAIKDEFQKQGIAKLMLNQLFDEAGIVFENLEVITNKELTPFFEKFGFINSNGLLIKKLKKKESKDIYDDYSSCKWMEP